MLHLRAAALSLLLAASSGPTAASAGVRGSGRVVDGRSGSNSSSPAPPPVVREKKVFSLFSIVQFRNNGCRSTEDLFTAGADGATSRNGTCMTRAECAQEGGSARGSCAASFGVCCVFTASVCGSVISRNCTYVQNPGFPSTLTDTGSCMFTVEKCTDDVCDLRLDFEQFSTNGPADTDETDGGACQDTFRATTTTQTMMPFICGENSGQHIYLDIGDRNGKATLDFNFVGSLAGGRVFDIKVTQIPCGSPLGQPDGCLQFHSGIDGRIESFNFNSQTQQQHLADQNYKICVRQEEGFCCVNWSVCRDQTNAFNFESGGTAINEMAMVGSACTQDYIVIEASNSLGSMGAPLQNIYCGGFLSDTAEAIADQVIKDCTQPFNVCFVTDDLPDATMSTIANGNRGFCLEYFQEPCTSLR